MPGPSSIYMQIPPHQTLLATLAKLKGAAPIALGMALREEAESTIDLCVDNYVPKDRGALAGSHFVREPSITPRGASVVLGFGGAAVAYASSVHENPRAGKTGGIAPDGRRYKHWADVGEWKYLEKAMAARAGRMARRIGARIRRDWELLLS